MLSSEKGCGLCVCNGAGSAFLKTNAKRKSRTIKNCSAKSLNSLASGLLENQKSKIGFFPPCIHRVCGMWPALAWERQRRKRTGFSCFCLDLAVKFAVRLNLPACDTTSLMCSSSGPLLYFLSRPVTPRQTPGPPTVLPAGPHSQAPEASSQPPGSFKLCQP